MEEDLENAVARLFEDAAEVHHEEFEEEKGQDPEWPLWYANYLLEHGINEHTSRELTKSELVYFLFKVDKRFDEEKPDEPWKRYYADLFVGEYGL